MQSDIKQVLLDRRRIAFRVEEVARQIAADLTAEAPAVAGPAEGRGPREITLVPILTGSIIFVADLIRHLPLRMKIRLVSISSYAGATTQSKGAQVQSTLTNLPDSFAGAHVLLMDDILDSGRTLRVAMDLIGAKRPATLRTCVLLRKQRPEALSFPVDYVCFDIPDDFVVGYGLDYNDYYRNLPDIVTLRPEVTGS
jgi:hypoxanthine phosphoribosyltransferase